MVLSMVGTIAPRVRERRVDSARAGACGMYPTSSTACAMRARSDALTVSGLLSARETEAIDTPACAATARIPCLEAFSDASAM